MNRSGINNTEARIQQPEQEHVFQQALKSRLWSASGGTPEFPVYHSSLAGRGSPKKM